MTKIYFDSIAELQKQYPTYSTREPKTCEYKNKVYERIGSGERHRGRFWRIIKVAQALFMSILGILPRYRKFVAKRWTEVKTGIEKLSFYVLQQEKKAIPPKSKPQSKEPLRPPSNDPLHHSKEESESPSSSDSEGEHSPFATPPSPTRLKDDPSGPARNPNKHDETTAPSAKRRLSFSDDVSNKNKPKVDQPKPLSSDPLTPFHPPKKEVDKAHSLKPLPLDPFKSPLRTPFPKGKPATKRPEMDPKLMKTPKDTPHPGLAKQLKEAGKNYTPYRIPKEPTVDKTDSPPTIPKAPIEINPKRKEMLDQMVRKYEKISVEFELIPLETCNALLSIIKKLEKGTLYFHTESLDKILQKDLFKDGALNFLLDIESKLEMLNKLLKKYDEISVELERIPQETGDVLLSIIEKLEKETLYFHTESLDKILQRDLFKDDALIFLIDIESKLEMLNKLLKKYDEISERELIPQETSDALLSIIVKLEMETLYFHADLLKELLEFDFSQKDALEYLQDMEDELSKEIQM